MLFHRDRQTERGTQKERETDRETKRDINDLSDFNLIVHLGDSNRQPQPSRENLKWYP